MEAPLVEDTASFIISGRRTLTTDVLAKPFVNPEAFSGSGYYFATSMPRSAGGPRPRTNFT